MKIFTTSFRMFLIITVTTVSILYVEAATKTNIFAYYVLYLLKLYIVLT